jgi:hypothetical protein
MISNNSIERTCNESNHFHKLFKELLKAIKLKLINLNYKINLIYDLKLKLSKK